MGTRVNLFVGLWVVATAFSPAAFAGQITVSDTVSPNQRLVAASSVYPRTYSTQFDLIAAGFNPATDVIFESWLDMDFYDAVADFGQQNDAVRIFADGQSFQTNSYLGSDWQTRFPIDYSSVESDGVLDITVEATSGDFVWNWGTLTVRGLRNAEPRVRATLYDSIAFDQTLDASAAPTSVSGVLDLADQGFTPETFEIYSLDFLIRFGDENSLSDRRARIDADGQTFFSNDDVGSGWSPTSFPLTIESVQSDGKVIVEVAAEQGEFVLRGVDLFVQGAQAQTSAVPEPSSIALGVIGTVTLAISYRRRRRH